MQAVVDAAQVDQHLGGVRQDLGVGGLRAAELGLIGDQILGDAQRLVQPAEGLERVHPAEPADPVGAVVAERRRDRLGRVRRDQCLRVVAANGQVVHVQREAGVRAVRRHQHRQAVHRPAAFRMALRSAGVLPM
ncbi:hypothetical protein Asi03nite_43590 [Actinoplanes siamensis]|uniref:Uncharacterized protein n=1 Tax=Actinoplanes siamensis TaxID=1223317 RepID=A0A919N9A2_9ACTN|nr:hypothetical protein Asi03nite_43590 [Actinoplanes siamensis]